MNAAPEDEPCETGPYATGLWARVRDWLVRWTAVFAPDEILRDGLSRRFALRCCNWLWPLEAAVRRLIIAAALAFDLSGLALASSRPGPRTPEKPPSSRATGFRVVSIRGAGAPRIAAVLYKTATARTERHLAFPSDDLLRLGAPHPRQGARIAAGGGNPLRRRGRIRPTDPDYIPASEADYANTSEDLFGSSNDREPSPGRDPGFRRDLGVRAPRRADHDEWRRIEAEWERILPAPGIAARITALAGVLNSPEPCILRLARRLAANPDLAALLRDAPPPQLRKPEYDRFGPQVDEDLAVLAYAATQPPDTS
jgi:hypothetical protein